MKRKKLTASMIALVMSVSLPMTTYAANWYLEDGSVTVNADNSGQTVTQGSGSAVPDEAPVITQRESSVETGNTITINAAENATANVTISDVNINTSDAAVSTSGKGNVNIELDGTNTLKSGVNHAGLEKNSDGNQGKLTITDENENGKLIATGGSDAAGIGGGYCGDGNDITIAGDRNVIAITTVAAADACCVRATGGDQLAVFIFIRNGQFTLITITVLFQTGMIHTTLKGICAIQFDVYIAFSACGNSSVACIDVYIGNGHVCRRVLSRIDRDCVACLYRALPLRNHRSLIRHGRAAALRYRLSGIVCVYRNAAIFQIPVGGIGCHGQAYAHDQGDHACCQLFSLHWVSSLFFFFIFYIIPCNENS